MVEARKRAALACEFAAMTDYQFGREGRVAAISNASYAAKAENFYKALMAAPEEAFATPPDDRWEMQAAMAAERQVELAATRQQFEVLLDILGNPTRHHSLDPQWLAWHGGTISKMAQAIYADRDWSTLPVLADALEDAGCADWELLGHLRAPGPHVRGCWALDLLLGLR